MQKLNAFQRVIFSLGILCMGYSLGWAADPVSLLSHSYHLEVKVAPELQRIAGSCNIRFRRDQERDPLFLRLDGHMQVAKVVFESRHLPFEHKAGRLRIALPPGQGSSGEITIFFSGSPQNTDPAQPGTGFVWTVDKENAPWVGIAGSTGALAPWWPQLEAEGQPADSMRISIITDRHLLGIANGELYHTEPITGQFNKYTWRVTQAIYPQEVTFYIGNYVRFRQMRSQLRSLSHPDFYVLKEYQPYAARHLEEMEAFVQFIEKQLGEYPLFAKRLTWVQSPYPPAGRQQATACGTQLPASGFASDLFQAFVHDWVGTAPQTGDHTPLWWAAAAGGYLELMFRSQRTGRDPYELFSAWEKEQARFSSPSAPSRVQGTRLLLALERQAPNQEQWMQRFRDFISSHSFRHFDEEEIVDYFVKHLGRSSRGLIEHYTQSNELPVFEFKVSRKRKQTVFSYRWEAGSPAFQMPVNVSYLGINKRLLPTRSWQKFEEKKLPPNKIEIEKLNALYLVRPARN